MSKKGHYLFALCIRQCLSRYKAIFSTLAKVDLAKNSHLQFWKKKHWLEDFFAIWIPSECLSLSFCCKRIFFCHISFCQSREIELCAFLHFSQVGWDTLDFFFIQLFLMCTIALSEMIDVTKSCRVCKYVTQQA